MTRISTLPVIATAMLSMSAVSAHAMDVYNCKELIHCLNNSIDINLMNDIKMDNKAFKDYLDFNYTCGYRAKFDGQGHTISGISYNDEDNDCIGLIQWCNGATVENVTVQYDKLVGDFNVGGIVGSATNSTFKNCHVSGNITSENFRQGNLGGIIGKANNCDISGCTVDARLICDGIGAGGIVGSSYGKLNVSDCTVSGYVQADGEEMKAQVGGIVGNVESDYDTTISNSTNNARVEGMNNYIGGIIGDIHRKYDVLDNEPVITIDHCTNHGAVAAKATGFFAIDRSKCVGGIVGHTYVGILTVNNCESTGNISGYEKIGGIIGRAEKNYAHPSLTDCKVSGNMYAETDEVKAFCGCDNVGINYNNCQENATIYIKNMPQQAESKTMSMTTTTDAAKKVMVGGKLTLVKANGTTVDMSGMMR